MTETVTGTHVKIAGEPFVLRRRDVVQAARRLNPEPITSHFVVVGDRRFPPKQIIGAVTGLDRADFTTHQARRTLMRLGFSAGRSGPATPSSRRATEPGIHQRQAAAAQGRPADRWRPFAGQWVAIRDEDVLHAADTPQALVGWLTRHGQRADSMFRVPEDDRAATGLAPL